MGCWVHHILVTLLIHGLQDFLVFTCNFLSGILPLICFEISFQYATFVILVILAQIAVVVLAFIFRDQLGSELENEMAEQAKNDVSFSPKANAITEAWNSLQYEVIESFVANDSLLSCMVDIQSVESLD